MNVKLRWATPDIDGELAYIARVSNPSNQDNPSIEGLLKYMLANGHVSPFEMSNMCVEINTTRDIGRQILRHRSFSFQEFSQRYAATTALDAAPLRETRMQDTKNRQNSVTTEDAELDLWWQQAQAKHQEATLELYNEALARGIAKEQARAPLGEGLTSSRMYMNGTIRSWLHYLTSRLDPSTQKEHRLIAGECRDILANLAPVTLAAAGL
jgi:thymidylate synthase (FAD)